MIRGLALLLVSGAVFVAAVMWAVAHLPVEGVAVHVDAHGTVNGYATRAQAVTLFAAIGAWIGGLAVVSLAAVRWLPVGLLRVPHRDHWVDPGRRPLLRRMMAWDVAVLFSLTLLGVSYLPVEVTRLTVDPGGHSQVWLPVIGGGFMLGLFGYVAWMVVARYRPARDPH